MQNEKTFSIYHGSEKKFKDKHEMARYLNDDLFC